jgi:hypothetical protein
LQLGRGARLNRRRVTRRPASGSQDAFVVKLTHGGGLQWDEHLGGAGATVEGKSLAVTPAGNVYATGDFNGVADFDPSNAQFVLGSTGSGREIYVIELDPVGSLVWVRQAGMGQVDAGNGIALDSSENVFAVGNFAGTANFDASGSGHAVPSQNGSYDGYVLELSSTGRFVTVRDLGGPSTETSTAVAANSQDSVSVLGRAQPPATIGPYVMPNAPGGNDLFAIRLVKVATAVFGDFDGGGSTDVGV